MALPDIRAVGALAGFERWGWPWHGIISGGTIGSTGKAHPQPVNNDAWLIDRGLSALDLTAEQIAAEAAAGREWRNYALIPGGHVYGTHLGNDTFIHIDIVGDAWRITLSYSFPSAQTLRITADITRFGFLIISDVPVVPVTVQKIVDVVCAEIELVNAVNTYSSRYAQIEDVWTNGSKVLLGVLLEQIPFNDLFSVVTLTLSGSGGTTGSGLEVTAVESIAQPNLTTGVDTGSYQTTGYLNAGIIVSGSNACPAGQTWTASFSIDLFPVDTWVIDYTTKNIKTYARYAFFSMAGDPIAVRLRMGYTDGYRRTPAVFELSYYSSVAGCGEGVALPGKQATWSKSSETKWGVWLLENDTVVDSVSRTRDITQTWFWNESVDGGSFSPAYLEFALPLISETYTTFESGSLASYLPPGASLPQMPNTLEDFRRSGVSAYRVFDNMGSGVYIGIHRMNAKATAFAVQTATGLVYATASTPLGNLAVGITPATTTNFAYQRKTGEYTFAVTPICYV